MKIHIFVIIILLALPLTALGASDDVTYQNGVIVSMTAGTYTIRPSEIATSTIGLLEINLVLESGSRFEISSADRHTFAFTSPSGVTTDYNCLANESTLLYDNVTATVDVTITPSPQICSSSGGGGGGGGGGTSSPPPAPSPTPSPSPAPASTGAGSSSPPPASPPVSPTPASTPTPAPSPTPEPVSTPVAAPTFSFTRSLTLESEGEDVRALQEFLNAQGFSVSDTGPGSPGNETDYFGQKTRAALALWQAANDITPAVGYFGPVSRAKYSEVAGSVPTPTPTPPPASGPAPAVSALFTRGLDLGSEGEDVRRLQQLLNSDPDTQVAGSGVGSPGNETNYFGNLSRAAVGKFQLKHGVVSSSSDVGYGYVGPKTRAKLGEVFSGQPSPATPALAPAPAPTPSSGSSSTSELQAQINAAQAQLEILIQQLEQSTQ